VLEVLNYVENEGSSCPCTSWSRPCRFDPDEWTHEWTQV
jgi:hypothetical protein